ncbi:MAG: molybdopterin synthase sulfur carrier subunit [Methylophaga sp.]|nr:MAG: molybdopterin synthase sulfur carrier subunit [Methylophaga sp.]
MSIQVKFFASLREKMGMSESKIDPVSTAGEVWDITTHNAERPINILVAINLEYAQFDSAVNDGDEVAFFPPVTGG